MRKHFYCLLKVFCDPEVDLQIQDATVRMSLTKLVQQDLGEVDCIGHWDFLDVSKIFQAPILFGIPEIELNFKSQTVIVDDSFIGEFQVAGKQVYLGKGTGLEIGLGDDDHIEHLFKLVMQHLCLIDASFDTIFGTLLDQILLLDTAIVDLLAKFLARTCGILLALIHEVQGGIITQFGNQMQTTLPDHLQIIVVSKVPIERHMADCNPILGCFLTISWIRFSSGVSSTWVLSWLWLPLGRPRLFFGVALAWFTHSFFTIFCCRFFYFRSDDLFHKQWKKASYFTGNQRQGKDVYALYHFVHQPGEKVIQTIWPFARLGRFNFIPNQKVLCSREVQVSHEEIPEDFWPGNNSVEKSPHRPITPPFPAQRERPNIVSRPLMLYIV